MNLSVSVIIPAYNSSKTILRALHSVTNQSISPLEIIVVDDGSNDNTQILVAENYPHIRLIAQENAGAAAARNTGAAIASGNLIAFLDSDDFWHSKKLEYQISVFERFSEIGICSTLCQFLTESPELNYQEKSQLPLEECQYKMIPFQKIFNSPYFGTPSVMMRKSLFQQVGGFDNSLETAEDVDLWLRASYHSQYLFIENPLTYVVGQEISLSNSALRSPFEAHIKVMDRFITQYPISFNFRQLTYRKTKSEVYCNWGSSLLVKRRANKAIGKLLLSLFIYPNLRAGYLLLKSILFLFKK